MLQWTAKSDVAIGPDNDELGFPAYSTLSFGVKILGAQGEDATVD
jgi:hypothetical protein